jgi:hypothetical protein
MDTHAGSIIARRLRGAADDDDLPRLLRNADPALLADRARPLPAETPDVETSSITVAGNTREEVRSAVAVAVVGVPAVNGELERTAVAARARLVAAAGSTTLATATAPLRVVAPK